MISRACLSARHPPLIETSSPIFSTSARIQTTDLTVARARSRRAFGTLGGRTSTGFATVTALNTRRRGTRCRRAERPSDCSSQRGAMWKPDPSTLNATRRILYRLEPDVTVELLARLLSQPNGEDAVRELLRVPRMRQHVASCERELSRLGLTMDGRRRAHVSPTRAAISLRPCAVRPRATLRGGLVRADAEGSSEVRDLRCGPHEGVQATPSPEATERVLGEEGRGQTRSAAPEARGRCRALRNLRTERV